MIKRWIWVLSVLVMTGGLIQAQEAISPTLGTVISQLEATTHSIRQLDALEDVDLNFPTRDDLRVYLETELAEQLPDELALSETLFYRAFDFLPDDVDLRQLYLDLYAAQVAGFYDPETDEMNVILTTGQQPEDTLPLLEKMIFVHEYVHALQDQHFDLQAMLPDDVALEDLEPDEILATLSLIEGDATLAMSTYLMQVTQANPASAIGLLVQGARAGALTLPPGLPPIITAELLFPYEAGNEFALALYVEADSWELIDAAFANPPISTEQIYHPEKYIAGEQPISVTLVDASAELGDGWTQVHDRTFGEFYLRQFLRAQLNRFEATIAAAGWGGDRFHVYHQPETDDLAWVMEIAWDTAEDSTEFNDAVIAFGEARYETTATDGCWQGVDDALCILAGENIRLASAPDVAAAQALIAAQP